MNAIRSAALPGRMPLAGMQATSSGNSIESQCSGIPTAPKANKIRLSPPADQPLPRLPRIEANRSNGQYEDARYVVGCLNAG